MTSIIEAQRIIEEITKERERLKKELQETKASRDDFLQQRNYLSKQYDTVVSKNKKLKEDLDHMTSLNAANFNEVNLQIEKVLKLKEENEFLINKNRSLCTTISQLEVQLQELKENNIGNLSLNAKLLDENKLLKNLNTTLVETIQSLNFVIKKL